MRLSDVLGFTMGVLRGHRLRTGLSLLGVAIGVTAVILLTSVGEGARTYVVGEFAAMGSNLLAVLPGKTETTGFAPFLGGAPHDLTLEDAEAIRHVAGVRRLAPVTIGRATVRFERRSRDVMVAGTTAEWARIHDVATSAGSFLPEATAEAERPVCVIGALIQSELFPGLNPLGRMLRIGDERYRVIGVTASRGTSMSMNFDDLVLIPVRRHMRMFDTTSVFRITVQVGTRDAIEATRARVVAALKARHGGEEDVTVLTQDAMLTSFGRILTALTALLAGIAAISLTVAGVGVMNVMLVSVAERTREIGLLKAVGATHGQILVLFLLESTLLAMAGGLAGAATAWGCTAIFSRVYAAFPLRPPTWAVGSALFVSVAIGITFGAWPARRAAELDPVAALAKR
jgi:putative ABC transport system permease protein